MSFEASADTETTTDGAALCFRIIILMIILRDVHGQTFWHGLRTQDETGAPGLCDLNIPTINLKPYPLIQPQHLTPKRLTP